MVMIVTEPARDKILELRAQEDDPDALGLRVEVTGVQGVEYTHDHPFDPAADASPGAGGEMGRAGPSEEKVRRVLGGQINPALAMHGGFAGLDRVEGSVVYVTMGG